MSHLCAFVLRLAAVAARHPLVPTAGGMAARFDLLDAADALDEGL